MKKNALLGKWFHSFDKDNYLVNWQRQIIEIVQRGVYVVQLYSWIMGEESVRHIVPIEKMFNWVIYDTHDEMNSEYKRLYQHRTPKEPK